MEMEIEIKRVYDEVDRDDGFRVLVDRVWPRGMTKEQVKADLWLKEVAPSTALRIWFGHDRSKWEDFRARYAKELEGKDEHIAKLLEKARYGRVTLLIASREREINQAIVLKDYLLARAARKSL